MPYSLCLSCQCNQALRQANGIVYLPLSPRSLPSLAVLIPSSPFSISIFYVQCVWQEKANLYLLHVNRPRVTLASSMYYLTFWVPRLKIPYDYQVCYSCSQTANRPTNGERKERDKRRKKKQSTRLSATHVMSLTHASQLASRLPAPVVLCHLPESIYPRSSLRNLPKTELSMPILSAVHSTDCISFS